MIDNVIFDFGNVLARFYPEELTAPYVNDEGMRKAISDVAFDRLYWAPLDEGTITDDEVKEGIRVRLPAQQAELGCKAYDNWVRNLTPVPNMKELVTDLQKAGKKVYLLSNISQKFSTEYKEVEWIRELLDSFDGLIFSSDYKLVKPHKQIFELLLDEFSLDADDCLFIDDTQANIKGAESAGIKGYHFDGNAQKLREYIYSI